MMNQECESKPEFDLDSELEIDRNSEVIEIKSKFSACMEYIYYMSEIPE